MNSPGILVACIGNIFLGDDAFGVEVARALATRVFPENVRVVDFGIRGFDLAFTLLDGADVTIFVDATPRGGAPGTLYTIEADLSHLDSGHSNPVEMETHGMNPMKVLALVKSMGGELGRILIVGCEPESANEDEECMGLSEPVLAAVLPAADVVENLVTRILEEKTHESIR